MDNDEQDLDALTDWLLDHSGAVLALLAIVFIASFL